MKEYQPPFQISNQMLITAAEISEKVSQIQSWHSFDAKPHLRRNNRIQSIHSSLKIEANSLSLEQVRDVIDGHLVLGKQSEIQEAKNAYAAYEMLSELDSFSLAALKQVHAVMMQDLLDQPGQFRRGEEGVFQGNVCIFMAPPARLVPGQMEQLFAWASRAFQEKLVHPLILAAVFHYEFVFIHPFVDGNGRMARLWHTVILSRWQPMFQYIPLESQIERRQEEYYQAIADSHVKGCSDPFLEFMLRQMNTILEETIDQIRDTELETTEYVKRLLFIMKVNVPYSAAALMEQLGLKSRDSFQKNYLHPAMEQHLIQRTIPEKPNSRNQRYIRT